MRLIILLVLLAVVSGNIFSQSLTGDRSSFSGCPDVPDTFYLHIHAGWNLISLPLIPDSNALKLFPSFSPYIFQFNRSYLEVDTIKPGVGYWVKFNRSETLAITGKYVTQLTCPIDVGWNLIGTPFGILSVADVQYSIPGMLTSGEFFPYNYDGLGGYTTGVTTLMPGYGYFVRANQPCTITLYGDTGIYNLSPPNGIAFSEPPLLEWKCLPYYPCFHVQIAAEPLFATPLVDTTVCETKYQSQFNSVDTIYYWRVGIERTDGSTRWLAMGWFVKKTGSKN